MLKHNLFIPECSLTAKAADLLRALMFRHTASYWRLWLTLGADLKARSARTPRSSSLKPDSCDSLYNSLVTAYLKPDCGCSPLLW